MKKLSLFLCVTLFVSSFGLPSLAREQDLATRIDAIVAIVSSANVELPTDVSIIKKYYDYVWAEDDEQPALAFALENGIIVGYENHSIRPKDSLTRAEFAVMIARSAKFFSESPKRTEFTANYPDLADWNKNEVAYCMERGFMMGYGDRFGASEYLTKRQVETVAARLQGGLMTVDRYKLLDLNGQSPINMTKILATGNDPGLADGCFSKPNIKDLVEDSGLGYDNAGILNYFEVYINELGNFNCEDYPTEESIIVKFEQVDKVTGYWYKKFGEYPFVRSYIKDKIKKEAFLISAPQNCYQKAYLGYVQIIGIKGYEYFIYHEANPEALPEGIELGKWYRRVIIVEKMVINTPTSGESVRFSQDYTNLEPLPAVFLN